ncbi:MAG: TIGR02587 family membrane protein [Phycisphaerales bacterium]|nr:TIGR02587 family membrane protein [Hyphomonadaceae bacterium]
MTNAEYARDLGRALVGAVLFALPLFMTMEMWALGVAVERERLATLLLVMLPMLIALSYFAGFERAFGLVDHVLDAFAAIAVAAIAGALILLLLGVFAPTQPLQEVVGKIAMVTFPGAIGALLVDKQLNDERKRDDSGGAGRSYFARLFLMAIGALFVALNVAPTEEMMLIAFQLSAWQSLVLALVSFAALHALLFWTEFPGKARWRGDAKFFSVLIRFTCAGYALCALASLFLLWAFGRTDGVALSELTEFVVVLSFPAVLGAGLAHRVVAEQRG